MSLLYFFQNIYTLFASLLIIIAIFLLIITVVYYQALVKSLLHKGFQSKLPELI